MGQKVHPGGMRVGVIHDWKSNWYTGKKEFPAYLIEDIKIREDIDYGFVEAKLPFGRIGVKVWINKGEIMPEGYGGLDTEKDVRLGEQDQTHRRRANVEGLGASRESGRDRQRDREGLGPVRPSRRGRGGQTRGRGAPRDRARGQDNVERPRTDEAAKSAEGREQPPVETTPPPVADAPDSTTQKQQTEDPT